MKKKIKLEIELIPQSCWFSNVRAMISKSQWNSLSRKIRSQSYDLCEICNAIEATDCHEIWKYDDKKLVQKLVGMIALCPDCHGVKHMGLSMIHGKEDRIIKHFMKVNKLTPDQAYDLINDAFELWAKRSKKKWTVDISHLKEYGIDYEKIKKAKGKTRAKRLQGVRD